jgi:hypothetical protein
MGLSTAALRQYDRVLVCAQDREPVVTRVDVDTNYPVAQQPSTSQNGCNAYASILHRKYTDQSSSEYYTHSNCTSLETRYVSAIEPNRLILCGETITVYCENHMEHTDTLCGQNAVRTSQETRYVSATEPNRLMLFGETIAVYCERHTEIHCGKNV